MKIIYLFRVSKMNRVRNECINRMLRLEANLKKLIWRRGEERLINWTTG